MCGRFGLTQPPWAIAKRLHAQFDDRLPFFPKYNIAPTQPVAAITNDEHRSLTSLRWGLIPAWAHNRSEMKISTFNARVETIATAKSCQASTRAKRCVVLADGFYEWRKNGDGSKTPLWIHQSDRKAFALAGLWEVWQSNDQEIASCTIVTTPANEFMQDTHSRMPIALNDELADEWLNLRILNPAEALAILVPDESSTNWSMHPVSSRVGNVRNDDRSLIEPDTIRKESFL